MRSFLAICLILVCFVDKSYGTFAEFMNNLPAEVASAFSNAWTSITDAIRKPVRIKRLGPGGSTAFPTTDGENFFQISVTTKSFIRSTKHLGNRLTLPLLPSPKFKNLEEWREMQKAHYAKRKKVANPAPIVIMIDPPDKAPKDKKATKKAITKYDDDSFATMMVLQ